MLTSSSPEQSLQPDSDKMKEVAYAIITEVYQQCSFAETAKAVVDILLAAKTISAIVDTVCEFLTDNALCCLADYRPQWYLQWVWKVSTVKAVEHFKL